MVDPKVEEQNKGGLQFRFSVIQGPTCKIGKVVVSPKEVVVGNPIEIAFDVCNGGGGSLNTSVAVAIRGPSPISSQRIRTGLVSPGKCVQLRAKVQIPVNARSGMYTGTISCLGMPGPVKPHHFAVKV